jgi:hypothetical protein
LGALKAPTFKNPLYPFNGPADIILNALSFRDCKLILLTNGSAAIALITKDWPV